MLRGVHFLVDDSGEKTAVQIDLREYGDLWEDFYDTLVARSRINEPRESLYEVKQQLISQDKLDE